MTRKQVLVIGMLDSIHLARWLEQFANEEIDFTLFPSKRFRRTHPKLKSLLIDNQTSATYKMPYSKFVRHSGYFDYLENEAPRFLGLHNSRFRKLKKLLTRNQFNSIHAIEIQGAGYLLTEINYDVLKLSKVIITNWGSDIYFFKRFEYHRIKIKKVLELADYYSAECQRDYKLARQLGFKGIELPCIPNAGGFDVQELDKVVFPPSKRNQVIVKAYGGSFGRADLVIELLEIVSDRFPLITFLFYSTTKDSKRLLLDLPKGIRSKSRIHYTASPLTHDNLLNEFRKSRVYIGCSESDGLSTSFIEALVTGAYPIQTNTSCAQELVDKGVRASLVALQKTEILEALSVALQDDNLVDEASEVNQTFVMKNLSKEVIKNQALTFYNI